MDRSFARPFLATAHYPLDWNAPARAGFVPFPHNALEEPIIARFAAAAARFPRRIAIDDGVTALSYAETMTRVRGLAARISAVTEPGAAVGGLLAESADFPLALLACLASGRLFLPLDLHYPRAWRDGMIADAGLAALILRPGGEEDTLIPAGVTALAIDGPDAPGDYIFTPARADDPALVIFTSGSSGKPKGIVNSQRALLRRIEQHVNGCHFDHQDGFMPLSSGCTIAGIRERLTALTTGAALYPMDVQRAGARAILERLEATRTTAVYAVPALLRTLAGLSERAPESLRVVRAGGDAVLWSDVDLLRRWLPQGCAIQLGYSSSEAPILQWIVGEEFPRDGLRVPIGYPLSDGELGIVDEDGNPATPGEIGELIVTSPYVALGHWRHGQIDRTPFPPAANNPHCRVLATGDLVRLRDDGLLDIIGRKDRQIKINGIRVEPGEAEAAIRIDPRVADAAILPRRLGRQVSLIGYIVPKAQSAANLEAEVKARLKASLPPHLQPRALYTVDGIPRLPSGKLDIKGLERLDAEQQAREAGLVQSAGEIAAPQGEAEKKIAAIWQRLLGRDAIGRDCEFFDAGGDSLLTLDLMFALEGEFGRTLPLTAIFEAPTIAALAALIESGAETAFSPLVKMKDGAGAPLFIVHGVGGTVMELRPLARALDYAGPVFAIQSRGLDGKEAPSANIGAQAQDYLTAIAAAHGHVEVHLAGYSAGGLIALEMAQRLAAAGRPALSLTLIDTQTHARHWPLAVWADFLIRRARLHLPRLYAARPAERWRLLGQMSKGLLRRLSRRFVRTLPQPAAGPAPDALRAVYAANMVAIRDFAPPRFAGAVTLIAAGQAHPDIANTAAIWDGQLPGLRIRTAAGDHFSMLRAGNVSGLAGALAAALSAR